MGNRCCNLVGDEAEMVAIECFHYESSTSSLKLSSHQELLLPSHQELLLPSLISRDEEDEFPNESYPYEFASLRTWASLHEELQLPPLSSSDEEEDELPMYPLPPPLDNSPIRRPNYFGVSSYATSDAIVRSNLRIPSRHVKFANSPTHSVHISEFGVQPYSEVYGTHPRTFDFDELGDKIPRETSFSLVHPLQKYCDRASYKRSGIDQGHALRHAFSNPDMHRSRMDEPLFG